MAGALAERVFAEKIEGVGFAGVEIHERMPVGLADLVGYPLFTPDLIAVMERLLSDEQKRRVALAVTLTARKPA